MNTPASADNDLARAYGRLKERLRAHLRGRGFEASVAADVVQEVFIKALAQQQAGKSITNIDGWLYEAVRNAAVDHLRATRPTVPIDEDFAAETAAEAADDVQLHATISACLRPLAASLPAKYRDALQAVEFEQRPLREIAQREGVSLSAIKSRASRGRKMLRHALLGCCALDFQDGLVAHAQRAGPCGCDGQTGDGDPGGLRCGT